MDVFRRWVRTFGAMSDDDEAHRRISHANHFNMDDAFCLRMRLAIQAGLENAPMGVVTTPGTKNPKYVPTEHRPLASARRDGDL
jgi:hypothetical protein